MNTYPQPPNPCAARVIGPFLGHQIAPESTIGGVPAYWWPRGGLVDPEPF